MKKRRLIIITFILCLAALFIFFGYPNIGLYPVEIEINEYAAIEAEVIDVDQKGMLVSLTNHSSAEYTFNAFYLLHVKRGNTWYNWKQKDIDREAVTVAYSIAANTKIEHEVEWPYWYKELKPGQYRLILDGSFGTQKANVPIEFSIK